MYFLKAIKKNKVLKSLRSEIKEDIFLSFINNCQIGFEISSVFELYETAFLTKMKF